MKDIVETTNLAKLKTNRDLYLQITGSLKDHAKTQPTLEVYLVRLWSLIAAHASNEPLSLDEFATVIDAAFRGHVSRPRYDHFRDIAENESAAGWLRQISRQIVDLHEMEITGDLHDKHRFFGINAPSGARWYNFEPSSFIECGISGTFSGWAPGDDTGRAYVPGPVGMLDESGSLVSMNPEDIDDPEVTMQAISWAEFEDFLWAGQNYE